MGAHLDITLTTGRLIQAKAGQSVLEALKGEGVYLVSPCGGKGTCGKCKIRLVRGKSKVVSYGKLTRKERDSGISLACQSYPAGDIVIEVPEGSRLVVGEKIALGRSDDLISLLESLGGGISPLIKRVDLRLPPPSITDNISDIDRLRRALEAEGLTGVRFSRDFSLGVSKILRDADWHATLSYVDGPEALFVSPAGTDKGYALAADIGTTTIVLYLADASSGRLIDVGSTYNSQMRYGDDVITRIVHATEGGGLGELRDAVVEDVNALVSAMLERHGILGTEVDSAVISGNTTMTHLFWGIDPSYIREEPYIPTLNFFPLWKAGSAGIRINRQAPVYTMPCVASYVGGDITAGVLASGMNRSHETALFMDIGTNGEIAIGNNEWIMAAACSAGPCFEGSGITCGMRATEGAIESIKIEPSSFEPTLGVIGGGPPVGICGSGMIDAVSGMFLSGLIDRKGRFIRELKNPRLREGEGGMEYAFCRGKEECGQQDVVLTEVDIENILRAKAAIYAGVTSLLDEAGLSMDSISRVYIAGGFGNYLNVEKAVMLGMLPDIPKEKYAFLGNTSIAGAYLCLVSEEMRREAEEIASKITYMELSVSRGFMDRYMSALFLPHTDIGLFPSVEALLKGKSP